MIKNIITIDSSVFISSFFEKEKFHLDSTFFINNLSQQESIRFILPTLVFLETMHVILRENNEINHKIIRIKSLFNLPIFNWVPLDFNFIEKFKNYYRSNSLKTSDAIIAFTSKIYDTILVTWDKKLLKESKKMGIKAFTPKEWTV